jgi:hypothetical protein
VQFDLGRGEAYVYWNDRNSGHSNEVIERDFNRETNEASMEAELNLLEVWIPEQMEPGTMFMLEQAGELGKVENPFWAVLACPSCGSLGLITRQQWAGLEAMICGSENCSSEYFLEDEKIRYRLAN